MSVPGHDALSATFAVGATDLTQTFDVAIEDADALGGSVQKSYAFFFPSDDRLGEHCVSPAALSTGSGVNGTSSFNTWSRVGGRLRMIAELISQPFHLSASDHVIASTIRSGCYQPKRQLSGGIATRKEDAPFHGAHPDSG